MFHLFHGKHQHDPNPDPFPTPADLSHLPPKVAETALKVLRGMVLIDTARVYAAAGSHGKGWNVWLEITRRRVTLEQWADEWLACQNTIQNTMPRRLDKPRFTVGQIVCWPTGRCTFRIAGPPSVSGNPPVRWYGGPVMSGESAGGYVLSVPEAQLELVTPETPKTHEMPSGGDVA